MRKIIPVLLAFVLALASGCGAKNEGAYRDSYYENIVLPSVLSAEKTQLRLQGMAEDVVLLPDSHGYDPDFINAGYGGLFDVSREEVLYLKKETDRLYPASMTKVMTALLVIENCRNLDEQVLVTEEAHAGLTDNSSMASLEIGCTYSVADLLYGLLIPSGNDAANVLAYHVAGTIPAFVDMMNERAQQLGMFDTHFMNPHGLHDRNHYTTVYDLYLLMKECIKYPMFLGAAGSQDATVTGTRQDGSKFSFSYRTGNSYLLGYTVPPDGLRVRCGKTGYTTQAGRCLVLVVQDSDRNFYIGVVAKAPTYDDLYFRMNDLLTLIGSE